MTDETTGESTAVVEPTTTPAASAPVAPVSIVGTDGKFGDGWRNLLPEDIRLEKCLNSVQDLQGMAKSLVHAQRMVGRDKIALPNEKSTESEWQAFYDAAGRPKTAADYAVAKPQDLPDELWNPDTAKSAQELFHKIGLSKKQAEALVDFQAKQSLGELNNFNQTKELSQKELEDGLHREWGQAYQKKVHLGNAAIEQGAGGNQDFKQRLVEKFGNDPDFIRFASNLGGKFAEHGVITSSNAKTPGEIKAQINEAMQTDAYRNAGNPGHRAAVQQVKQMFEQMHQDQG